MWPSSRIKWFVRIVCMIVCILIMIDIIKWKLCIFRIKYRQMQITRSQIRIYIIIAIILHKNFVLQKAVKNLSQSILWSIKGDILFCPFVTSYEGIADRIFVDICWVLSISSLFMLEKNNVTLDLVVNNTKYLSPITLHTLFYNTCCIQNESIL